MERVDESIRRIAGHDIDLVIDKSAIEKAEIHDVGRSGEVETVTLAPAAETVGAFQKFITDADTPLGGNGSEIGHGAEMEALRIIASDNHGKGIFEAERLGELEVEALGVLILYASVDGGGSVAG